MSETTLPPVDERRAMLTESVANYRRQGFVNQMESLALEAQTPHASARDQYNKQLFQLRETSKNMYAAADRLQRELDALPEAEAVPGDDGP